MIYVISDLHGFPHDLFLKLLETAGFSGKDYLYILGDVIDRNGDGGIGTLCWLLEQPNVQLILGNHESMLLSCEFLFDEVTDSSIDHLSVEKLELLNTYMLNGGNVTLDSLRRLDKEMQTDILEYLHEAPLYDAVTVDNTDYLLVHAGLENFARDKRLSSYSADELMWKSPRIDEMYYDDITTVFGHTPTFSYGEAFRGKILKTATWIDIDTGAGFGEKPVLLRLDDLHEFRL